MITTKPTMTTTTTTDHEDATQMRITTSDNGKLWWWWRRSTIHDGWVKIDDLWLMMDVWWLTTKISQWQATMRNDEDDDKWRGNDEDDDKWQQSFVCRDTYHIIQKYRKHVGHIHDNAAGNNHGNSTCNVPGIPWAKLCIYVMCITSFMFLLFMVLLFESIMSII